MAIDSDEEREGESNTQVGLGSLLNTSSSSGTNTGSGGGGLPGQHITLTANTNSNALIRSALVATSGGFGFTEPTSKMKLFVEMFDKNMGQPAFAPLLTAALLARGLGTAMMLSNVTMMSRLRTACVAEWSAAAGRDGYGDWGRYKYEQ